MGGGGVAGSDGNPAGIVGAGMEGGQRELQACLLQILSEEEDTSVRRKVCSGGLDRSWRRGGGGVVGGVWGCRDGHTGRGKRQPGLRW